MNAGQRLNALSVIKRREKAAARRAKVKYLREQGLSGREIAAEMGIKVRTVYQDFSILKKDSDTAGDTSQ